VLEILLNGIGLGIILSFLIGPVFFVLIETSLRKGPIYAMFIDIGVLLSDVLYLILAYKASQSIQEYYEDYAFVKYIAAGIFIIMGVVAILKKESPQKGANVDIDEVLSDEVDPKDPNCTTEECKEERFKKRTALGLILQGIGLNVINPGVLLYWIVACTTAQEELHVPDNMLAYYFGVTLLTFFSLDMIKIYFAGRLKEKMTPKILGLISTIVGCIFILAGLAICFKDF